MRSRPSSPVEGIRSSSSSSSSSDDDDDDDDDDNYNHHDHQHHHQHSGRPPWPPTAERRRALAQGERFRRTLRGAAGRVYVQSPY